ncbi:SusD-like starch-binding protein associating with outer membrane [Mucilaginibacter gracilis]|uniref:SusD-like starch-binding protein associating with outer membrane n=1 Tax=Mucilaginibacter gracilis TaxID=423350 RepID=A0A495IYY0_9SPHI|nr:SusD/RagB family nutrient-binding outer membrane lipoprotein [Mucilaginibacter gracilis]RKR81713.1 SusD-like starch-binding protein associating with outer membrane [Mucilaginibacter gracilis]
MRNIYKLLTITTALLATASGCTKYLDINSNPVVPQIVKAELLLPPIEYQMCNGTEQDYTRSISKLTQNMAGVDASSVATYYWEQHGYPGASDVGGVVWRMVYFDLGINLENLIKDAVANQKYEYAGIGYAIKAWAYQIGTDEYGPLNITDAFTAGQLTYSYQDQPDVYAKVREWGNLSVKYMNMTSPVNYAPTLQATATGDGIYKGDKTKWKKFVYGLFALQYGHLVNKAEYKTQYADSVVKYVGLSLANETEDASIYFNAATYVDANPLGPLNAGTSNTGLLNSSTGYGRQTTTILGLLTGGVRGTPTPSPTTSLDPRLSRFLTPGLAVSASNPTSNGSPIYNAVTPTLGSNLTTEPTVLGYLPSGQTYYNGKYIFTDKARYPIMTYSQLQFALAEAYFIKNSNVGNTAAVTAYRNGISATFDFYNQYGRTALTPDAAISTTEISNYMASSEVVQLASPTDLTIADIMQQKYIAQWGWAGTETWCDLRKYKYSPTVFRTYYQIPTATLMFGKYAYRNRPRYNSEYVWNAAALNAIGGLAPNYNTVEMWFSQP